MAHRAVKGSIVAYGEHKEGPHPMYVDAWSCTFS